MAESEAETLPPSSISLAEAAERIRSRLVGSEAQKHLGVYPDPDGVYVRITNYEVEGSVLSEVRLRRSGSREMNLHLFPSLTTFYVGVAKLAEELQDLGLDVTGIVPNPEHELDEDKRKMIRDLNEGLRKRWAEKSAASE